MPNWKPSWLITAIRQASGVSVTFLVNQDNVTKPYGILPDSVTLLEPTVRMTVKFDWARPVWPESAEEASPSIVNTTCTVHAVDGTAVTVQDDAGGDIIITIRRVLYDQPREPSPPPKPAPVYNPNEFAVGPDSFARDYVDAGFSRAEATASAKRPPGRPHPSQTKTGFGGRRTVPLDPLESHD